MRCCLCPSAVIDEVLSGIDEVLSVIDEVLSVMGEVRCCTSIIDTARPALLVIVLLSTRSSTWYCTVPIQ